MLILFVNSLVHHVSTRYVPCWLPISLGVHLVNPIAILSQSLWFTSLIYTFVGIMCKIITINAFFHLTFLYIVHFILDLVERWKCLNLHSKFPFNVFKSSLLGGLYGHGKIYLWHDILFVECECQCFLSCPLSSTWRVVTA